MVVCFFAPLLYLSVSTYVVPFFYVCMSNL
jgi:hypothetical protein